jgi:hypothetical protein
MNVFTFLQLSIEDKLFVNFTCRTFCTSAVFSTVYNLDNATCSAASGKFLHDFNVGHFPGIYFFNVLTITIYFVLSFTCEFEQQLPQDLLPGSNNKIFSFTHSLMLCYNIYFSKSFIIFGNLLGRLNVRMQ